jgi:hypothetical protein
MNRDAAWALLTEYTKSDSLLFRGCEILRAQGYPEWVMRAIFSHADRGAL